jgi:hypothetical protein
MMTSPHNSVDLHVWQCAIFRSEVRSPQRTRCQRQTIAAGLPAFVYWKRAGKQRLIIGCLQVIPCSPVLSSQLNVCLLRYMAEQHPVAYVIFFTRNACIICVFSILQNILSVHPDIWSICEQAPPHACLSQAALLRRHQLAFWKQ